LTGVPGLTGEELSVTDLAKRAGLAYPTAHREVARLVDAGILSERQVGRTRLIRANGESPLVDPLREILSIATGPVVILAEEFAHIDVMVLGEPDVDAVYEACARTEASVHRPVSPTILTPEEFAAPSGFLDQLPLLTSVVVRYDIVTAPVTTPARRCWRRTVSGRPTGPASTRRSAAICVPSSTSHPRKGRRESSTSCDALATRTATRRSRWVPRRPRSPSRSPGRSTRTARGRKRPRPWDWAAACPGGELTPSCTD
jgi:DNA-binding transcriptional ArsR family regulator